MLDVFDINLGNLSIVTVYPQTTESVATLLSEENDTRNELDLHILLIPRIIVELPSHTVESSSGTKSASVNEVEIKNSDLSAHRVPQNHCNFVRKLQSTRVTTHHVQILRLQKIWQMASKTCWKTKL